MIVLFISDLRINLLDELVNKHFLTITKIKTKSLSNFASSNSNNLLNCTHLIVDLSALNDNENEIVESLNTITRIYSDIRIIILADEEDIKDNENHLLRRIFEKGIYNIVLDSKEKTIENCILQGMTKEETSRFLLVRPDLTVEEKRLELEREIAVNKQSELQKQQEKEKEEALELAKCRETIIPNKDFRKYKSFVSVGVCGAEPHIGTTQNALLITKFLNDIGFKACYLEANEVHKIFFLKAMYPQSANVNERKHLMQCKGIDMYSGFNISEVMSNGYDFYIFDLGVLEQTKLTSFLTKDLKIIVGGSKAWEMPPLVNALKMIGVKNIVYFLLNFVINGEQSKIQNSLGEFRKYTYFTQHDTNPFSSNVNLEIYKNIFKEYLVQQTERETKVEPKKKSLFNKFKK